MSAEAAGADLDALRRLLERDCAAALGEFSRFESEETYHRAGGRIEGMLQGVAALCRAAGERLDAEAVLALAREVTERFSAALAEAGRDLAP